MVSTSICVFKIVSVNVRGVADTKNRRAIFDKHRFNADILILHETHSTPVCENIWEAEWGGKAIFSHGTSQARGVTVFIKKGVSGKFTNIYKDLEGRLIIFDYEDYDVKITIVALYAPNQDKPSFFEQIRDQIKERSEHKILVGDYNLVLDVELDRENTYCNNNKSKDVILDIMEQFYLRDVWRLQHGLKREFSWRKKRSMPLKASRIDFGLVSAGLDQKVEITQYITSVFTDHRAFYMCIDIEPVERGTGYWKLNNLLLKKQDYITQLNEEIEKTLQATIGQSAKLRWENLKTRIKKKSVEFSRKQGAEDKLIISQLCEKIDEYESRLPLNIDEDLILENTKKELEDKTLERTQGIMFRSKAKWYEEGERNTKYFFSLEKSRYNAKTCYRLITNEGEEIRSQQLIIKEQEKFYEDLYSEDNDVMFNMVNTFNVKVPQSIKQQQDQDITMRDLEEAIKGMNNDKTPGSDGIPIDFYKVFWGKLKEVYYSMVNESYQDMNLHSTARQGILNLIPKADKDTRYIKNLRPITLLNTDYKIIEKAVANKMLPALEHIIHTDQRGFMKNRRISVNIRKMLDIMHQAEKEDLEAVILSLDFVKCFDKCSFSILHGSLDFFGFGEVVREWTKILYKDFSVRIQNNGNFSESIPINKGVHQGGCCSSVYFLVIAEILALSLRDNENIDGITIKDIKNLLNQFADDMDIGTMCNEKSIRQIFEELEKFRLQSGFTVSYDKTTLYRIGSLRHSNAQLYDINQVKWSNEDISVLGVQIAHENIVEKNFEHLIEKTKRILNTWYNRGLSLLGKVQIVNTLIASLFVYKMMVLPAMPSAMFKKLDNIIRDYIWKGKKSKIALNILQNPKEEGGLNLVNLRKKDKALKTTWPQILNKETEYAQMVYGIMRVPALKENIWRCNLNPKDIKLFRIESDFWREVLTNWCQFNYFNKKREENQIIWYNSSIRIKDKPFFWKNNYNKGLMCVHQLFDDQKFKPYEQVYREYGLTMMRYNSLKCALPNEWVTFFEENPKGTFCPIAPYIFDECIYTLKTSLANKVYKFLSEDVMLLHNKYMKWRNELGEDFCQGLRNFGDCHKDIYRITNIPKYRSFQYRVLQRAIVTNVDLEKWGIITTNLCTFCGDEPETLLHIMCFCVETQELWENFKIYVENRFRMNIECEPSNLIMNRIVEKKNHVINFLCLITKYFIYSQRCQCRAIKFPALRMIFNSVENMEKYIAIKNNRLHIHYRKWVVRQPIEVNLQNYVLQYINTM